VSIDSIVQIFFWSKCQSQCEESSHDEDGNPSFDKISNDNPEDELEPWFDYMTRATHKAGDLSAGD